MDRPFRYCIVLLALVSATAGTRASRAQSDPGQDYFPLEVGNAWVYFEVLFPPPDFLPDTLKTGSLAIDGQVVREDTLYYEVPVLRTGLVRADEDGNLRGYIEGVGSVLLFDFSLPDGAIVTFDENHPLSPGYELSVSREELRETRLGRVTDTIAFNYHEPTALDADFSFTFAPGVGVIEYVDGQGTRSQVYSAYVGGAYVQELESTEAVPAYFSMGAPYPNPSTSGTTIPLTLSRPSPVRIELFDLLGRSVGWVEDGLRMPGVQKAFIDASGLTPGLYVVRIQAGQVRKSRTVTVLR